MPDMTEDEKLLQAVGDTGFCLEYDVYYILRSHRWNVITNRYYIDDIKGSEREIDIVAYKGKEIECVVYYTVLIISCKMAKKSLWAFLTHEKEQEDPNFNYMPIHNVSSDKILNYFISNESSLYIERLVADDKVNELYKIDHKVFAFQQLNRESYKTEDDKKIYESIITTIKALEHEKMNHKNTRVKDDCTTFYNFNLISIFDHGMKEIFFDNSDKSVLSIDNIKYVNRHIINNKDNFYMVHFIDKGAFEHCLELYDNLFIENNKVYSGLQDEFYTSVWEQPKRVKLFWKQFEDELSREMKYFLRNSMSGIPEQYTYTDELTRDNNMLYIHIDSFWKDEELKLIIRMNEDRKFKEEVSKLLINYYQYFGDFRLAEAYLPF